MRREWATRRRRQPAARETQIDTKSASGCEHGSFCALPRRLTLFAEGPHRHVLVLPLALDLRPDLLLGIPQRGLNIGPCLLDSRGTSLILQLKLRLLAQGLGFAIRRVARVCERAITANLLGVRIITACHLQLVLAISSSAILQCLACHCLSRSCGLTYSRGSLGSRRSRKLLRCDDVIVLGCGPDALLLCCWPRHHGSGDRALEVRLQADYKRT